jgi:hypothetical protein
MRSEPISAFVVPIKIREHPGSLGPEWLEQGGAEFGRPVPGTNERSRLSLIALDDNPDAVPGGIGPVVFTFLNGGEGRRVFDPIAFALNDATWRHLVFGDV